MSEKNQPKITRRNLMITTGAAAGATTGVVGGSSTMAEPASAQKLSGDVEVNASHGRGINMDGKPSGILIDGSSEFVLSNISSRNKEPAMLRVQARWKDNPDDTYSSWDTIGEAGFIIESTEETVPASKLDERDLLTHEDFGDNAFDILYNTDKSDFDDVNERYIRKYFQIRVPVETLSGGTVISEDEAEKFDFRISFGYQFGVGRGLGFNLGRVAPEYNQTDPKIRWDLLPEVPDEEPPDADPYDND